MAADRLVSIVVNSYNYGRFLAEAIDSALDQTYLRREVVVVDDASTDCSRDVIAGYAGRVVEALKENGGQASAFNAGFRASRGEVVIFLDADDLLLPTAAARAVDALARPGVAKAHWNLWAIDEGGRRTGQLIPGSELPEGDIFESVVSRGPGGNVWPPTTGNASARWFLEAILPVPEQPFRICADAYLFTLAPACGRLATVPEPQGCYRIHGHNNYWSRSFHEKAAQGLAIFEQQCSVLGGFLDRRGSKPNLTKWRGNSWWHEAYEAVGEMTSMLPEKAAFILVDDNQFGAYGLVSGRHCLPFLEKDGVYWGAPATDEVAIEELERLRFAGVGWLVVCWPAFWWLAHYADFHRHLRQNFRCPLRNERLVVFDLHSPAAL